MENFDLKKYLAEGRLFEEEAEDSMSVPFTGQTSFPKDEKTAKAAVAQLQSGNPDAPIIKAMGGFGDANKAKAWVEKIGPDIIVKRILDIASKIPSQGLAKADMPFLPGPPDAKGKASDVEDALTPGGKYNIDFKEAVEPPTKNTISPGSEEAEDYMTSGVKDGKPSDDSVTVKVPAAVAASDAKPTQTNILLGKSLSMAIGGVEGGDIEAWIGTDGSILDGHHRWAATMLNNPSAKLGAAGAIDMKGMGDQTTALKHLTAIGNALGNKTKTNENKMDNFDLKKFVSGKTLLNESTPGYDTRKQGEALPTLESVKAAYEAKKGIEEKNDYANSEEDFTDRMVIEKIFDIIRYHELDPSDMLEEIGQEFGIDFEFGAGNGRGSQEQEARIKAMQRGLGHS